MTVLRNIPFDRLQVGMEASSTRICVSDDLFIFAHASGNLNPMHLPPEEGETELRTEPVAPSMWVATLISAVLGNELPGPGTIYLSQSVRFLGRAHAGDSLTAKVRLVAKAEDRKVRFETWVEGANGTRIADGEAEVIAPDHDMTYDATNIPGLQVQRHVHFDALLRRAEPLPPMRTAVVAPEDANSLGGTVLAARHSIIEPILLGKRSLIEAAAAEIGADITAFELIDCDNHRDAASRAVAMVNEGSAVTLMKGHLHTDELLGQVVKRDGGLRVGRRLSHVFVMDVPGLDHMLFVSDAAINIAPDLETKVDIVQNCIDLAIALGVELPKVGVLSAVETVNPKIPSTLDAAVLSKMAERGQIRGGVVDGPLAMDNAIDLQAARTKGIKSLVAGKADILIAPNLESGNMLAKELSFVAHAEAGGIVLGAKCPIILTSRSDGDKARLASCAIAALYAGGRLQ